MGSYVGEEGDEYGFTSDSSAMFTDEAVVLDLHLLCERLAEVDVEDYYPLVVSE